MNILAAIFSILFLIPFVLTADIQAPFILAYTISTGIAFLFLTTFLSLALTTPRQTYLRGKTWTRFLESAFYAFFIPVFWIGILPVSIGFITVMSTGTLAQLFAVLAYLFLTATVYFFLILVKTRHKGRTKRKHRISLIILMILGTCATSIVINGLERFQL